MLYMDTLIWYYITKSDRGTYRKKIQVVLSVT